MAKLLSTTRQQTLIEDLEVATSFWSRAKGLLGRRGLSSEQGLWIVQGNSIHTFFMKFSIDCVFLDKKMRVVSIVENCAPGRLVLPQWGAHSVIELPSGKVKQLQLMKGEVLHVVH